jgi:transcriptional regulator CtsR
MGITDMIAAFIRESLENDNGQTELQRFELAERFNCVPSQINYVISTRFSPEHGYVVESRRGGGGYIRIRQVHSSPEMLLMHTVNAVGDAISAGAARAFVQNLLAAGAMDLPAARLMAAALSDSAWRSVTPDIRDSARAAVFKQMLLALQ